MQIQKQLTQITKDLEMVSKKVRQLTESLTGVEGKKSIKSRSVSRNGNKSGTDTVLDMIRKSKRGVDALTLIQRTGFEGKKIRNILFQGLKSQKIERVSRGIYKISK